MGQTGSPFSCPWQDSGNWSVHADHLAPPGSQDDTTPYLSFIRHLNARFIISTNGSATAGTQNGGTLMVVTEGDPAGPTTLRTKPHRGAAFTSSYDEELAAMRMVLEWLLPSHAATAICTDRQSLLKAIQSDYADTACLGACFTNETARPPYSRSQATRFLAMRRWMLSMRLQ